MRRAVAGRAHPGCAASDSAYFSAHELCVFFLAEAFVFFGVLSAFDCDVDDLTELVEIAFFVNALCAGFVLKIDFIVIHLVVGNEHIALEESALDIELEGCHILEGCCLEAMERAP